MKKIGKAILALILTSVILLLLDIENCNKQEKNSLPQIAIFKIASRLVLDETENGIIEGLSERGYINNETTNIQSFSAEGDMGTANMIAQNIINSNFDMVITISTPALQVMANANKEGRIMHIFGAVTDPYVAGVGITGSKPNEHPAHLVGVGTFQPVEEAFSIAKEMNPLLEKVGTVWCTSETCSEACVKKARKKCNELDIELLEASVESSTQVLESALSLTLRGVDALWLGGDNVVESGIDQLISAANKVKIPVFTNNPFKVYDNVLFGLGANYFEVGKHVGNVAADVLNGKPTNEIGISNVVPNNLIINSEALKNINQKWHIAKYVGKK